MTKRTAKAGVQKHPDKDLLDSIARRAHYLATRMIYMANHREDVEKGDPKIGGHPAASASALHILGALHLVVKSGFDHVANKPHASPADHSYNYLLDLFLNPDLSRMSLEEANQAMTGLRAFSKQGEPVFQSYHSAYDPDHHNFFPSGTVGIPPVNAGYLAHAYQLARKQGYEVPEAHFWAVMGDSEFREGSLLEAAPDFAEREVGSLTWIVDYNRQSLDGHRITNPEIMQGNDDLRIQRTMEANGWEVIQVRHGSLRQELFQRPGGQDFQNLLENEISDYELQVLLQLKSAQEIREEMGKYHKKIQNFVSKLSDQELVQSLTDLGGHDFLALIEALRASQRNPRVPTMIVAHTIKGWGLKMASTPGNHSALPDLEEVEDLARAQGLKEGELFARFPRKTKEQSFLEKRGQELYGQIQEQQAIKERNRAQVHQALAQWGEIPQALDINLKMASYPHTQWMLGQLTAKLTRIANTSLSGEGKTLNEFEKSWKTAAEMMISMAPDVGTSTNLNPTMDGKIFAAIHVDDMEKEFGVKDPKTPDLVPGEERSDRFLRFEIAEANTMSCMGSYGKMRDTLGIPLLPLMTVYDFFVKRAHDQFFYNLYWRSSFILVGTPSGVTLSPEGAQHGWKSDYQIPNQITWEPFFCLELDWIFCDAFRRHMLEDNDERSGVFIRGVTRGVEQKMFLNLARTQARFKAGLSSDQLLSHRDYPLAGAINESEVTPREDAEILEVLRQEVLEGAYFLIDYRGYAGYEPGDNVVHIFSMGSPTTEAIKTSQALLAKGVYANVIVVTSPDLLLGNLGQKNDYQHLRQGLGISADLYLKPQEPSHSAEVVTLAGRRTPIVSLHDGEVGLLDNIGSIVGVRQEALAVRKHSRCGRPADVYRYHGIDSESVVQACEKVLSETAMEKVEIHRPLWESIR